jgi:hypothetical protein
MTQIAAGNRQNLTCCRDAHQKIQLIPTTTKSFLTLAQTSTPPLSDDFRTIATGTDPSRWRKRTAK